jgi:adenylate cyclase
VSLRIQVGYAAQKQLIDHEGGPIEFGRGPQRQAKRIVIADKFVSRDQLRVEELTNGRIRVENLSHTNPLDLPDGTRIGTSQTRVMDVPIHLSVGDTKIFIERDLPSAPSNEPAPATVKKSRNVAPEAECQQILVPLPPVPGPSRRGRLLRSRVESAAEEMPDGLTDWLQTVIELQQQSAGSPEFFGRTAQALVDLIGLDLGLVLLRRNETWSIVGSAVVDDHVSVFYSRTLLNHVVAQRQTFYEDLKQLSVEASLSKLEAAVAAPVFGLNEDVVGVLYGGRTQGPMARGGIQPLEAQLVQLLAAAVGANLARVTALRTRVQFEQFFSPDLVRELERDPNLLEGRSQEVTVLFSDLRGFTTLSQRLGAQTTCRLVRDMMERLSDRIVEHGGVIVDYAGDGILAMWNAPATQADHAARACQAGLAMLGELPELNARWKEEIGGPLTLGIGVNTGTAQVGNTGSTRKFKYGPHGHTVNMASRVQDATKRLGLPLLITGSTREQLQSNYPTRRLGQVRLPGVKEPVVLFELHGIEPPQEWLALRDGYEAALTQFEAGQWSRACQTLIPLLASSEQPDHYDTSMLKLMRRAWECLEAPPNPFEPIIEVSSK